MGLLHDIVHAAATRQAADAQALAVEAVRREDQAASSRRIAEAQYNALGRWHPEFVPAIAAAASKLNVSLGGLTTGNFLKEHSASSAQIMRGQIVLGAQMSVTLNFERGHRRNHFIKFTLEATNGPDAVVMAISHDQRTVVRLVVDDSFKKGTIEYHLARIVRDIEASPPK